MEKHPFMPETQAPVTGASSVTGLTGKNGEAVNRLIEENAYRKALAETLAATDAMEAERAARFPEGSEERETVNRVFARVRKAETEFFSHVYETMSAFLADSGAEFVKFKERPACSIPKKTVVLWDVDETVVYNDARVKKSYVRPAFFPLIDLLREKFPDVEFGLLTSRSVPRLDRQLADPEMEHSIACISHLLNPRYVFGKDSYEQTNLGAWRNFYVSKEESERMGYEDKVRGFHAVNQKEPATRFLLVDDVLQKHFETIGAGVRVSDAMRAAVMEALPI